MIYVFICILIGLGAGFLSGIVGIGGGVIIVPALVYFLKLTQHTAQGTTLALMLPPIGLLGAINYYHHGFIDVKTALWVAVGVFLGVYVGSKLAITLSDNTLKKIFAVILMAVSVKMVLEK